MSFEIEPKDPVDYMEAMPLVFGEIPKKASEQPSTASSGSDGEKYVSPKATFTEEEFLEKHSASKEEPEPKSEFIKYFFDKMKDKQKGENY